MRAELCSEGIVDDVFRGGSLAGDCGGSVLRCYGGASRGGGFCLDGLSHFYLLLGDDEVFGVEELDGEHTERRVEGEQQVGEDRVYLKLREGSAD